MELKYTPKKESGFTGNVIVDVPPYAERLKILKEMNFKANGNGEVEASTGEQLDYVKKICELVALRVKAVNVKHKESGQSFSSIGELEFFEEGVELINNIGNTILSGMRLGKR